MGASGDNNIIISNKISSVLISFTKITELSKVLISKNNGKLSNFFASFIKDHKNLDAKVEEFKKLLDNRFEYKIYNLIKYILETLHKELNTNKNNPNWLDDFNKKDNNPLEEEFLKAYKKNEDSIIKQLFFGVKEIISKCSTCETCDKIYGIMNLEKLFELSENQNKIDIREFVKRLRNLRMEEQNCQKCEEKTQHIINTNIIELPEILIIYIDKRYNDFIFDYYLQCQLFNDKYNLISFISNKNEYNQIEEEKNNVFYRDNGNWYVYKTNENKKVLVKDILKINGNPIVVFYQKDKTVFNKFYNNISLLLNDKENTMELSNEHIIPEINYEKYYLLNKDWFNKLIKIYEPENIYSKNEYTIDSFEKVTNVKNTTIKIFEFNERIKIFENEHFFKVHYGTYENESNTKRNYPKNFVLIKEKILNEILKEVNVSTYKYKNFLYSVKFGENYIFIKNNKEERGETIYVCILDKKEFKVGIILTYTTKGYFDKEIKKYISNRGGLEYYYQERKLKVNYKKSQEIFDRETDKIGYLINIISLNDYISPYKFNNNDEVFINGVGKNVFQMSIFENLNNLNNSILNNNNNSFSNMNYGNNPINQINMPNQQFVNNIPTSISQK